MTEAEQIEAVLSDPLDAVREIARLRAKLDERPAVPPPVCSGTGSVPTDFMPIGSAIQMVGTCGICQAQYGLNQGMLVTHPYVVRHDPQYVAGWRAGVVSARQYLRHIWDDGDQGNANDAAELWLLDRLAQGEP